MPDRQARRLAAAASPRGDKSLFIETYFGNHPVVRQGSDRLTIDWGDATPSANPLGQAAEMFGVENKTAAEKTLTTTGDGDFSREEPSTSKFVTMSNPEYIVFTDSELEQARHSYFEKKRLGTECAEPLSKELFCRLVRNTMTNMISIARAAEDSRYPSKYEVDAMAKRLMEYYPMLKETCGEWEHVAKKLMKRLSNVKSPRKGKKPPAKKPRKDGNESVAKSDSSGESSASTIILDKSPVRSMGTPVHHQDGSDEESGSADFFDSQKTQARHYKTLQEIYKTKKPNKAAVTQLLNLEFESRRQFINSDAIKEQDRASDWVSVCIFQVLDELRRIIQPSNLKYISEMKDRWEIFYSKVQFYGVMKKVMKPPKTLDGGICSEVFFHVLKTSEDPEGYLRQRPLACPVLLVSEGNCMIAVGTTPVSTFDRKDLNEGLLYLMAYYYALHLTYPKCISTLLSVLQTEILKDSIHDRDSTPSYRKALGEWKSFIEVVVVRGMRSTLALGNMVRLQPILQM
ncbi:KRAB domain-containing zinc finger protein [Sarotherodon galilaeus]